MSIACGLTSAGSVFLVNARYYCCSWSYSGRFRYLTNAWKISDFPGMQRSAGNGLNFSPCFVLLFLLGWVSYLNGHTSYWTHSQNPRFATVIKYAVYSVRVSSTKEKEKKKGVYFPDTLGHSIGLMYGGKFIAAVAMGYSTWRAGSSVSSESLH